MIAEEIAKQKSALRLRMRQAEATWKGPALRVPGPLRTRLDSVGIIASYLPIGGEIDPSPIANAAIERGWRLALPHVTTRSAPMRFLAWAPGESLVGGPFGLRQPAPDAVELCPDLILTPLVAFDAQRHRLGHGAGYYDRAFAALPRALRIGVAWSTQQVTKVPVDAWDVPLHAVATEKGWIGPDTL